MRIQIIGMDNSYGLSKDRQVLSSVLAGHSLFYARPNKVERGKFDLNVHLEHIVPRNFESAEMNISIPNPEWCSRGMVSALRGIDAILCKTRHAERIFNKGRHRSVHYIGWTSPDPYIAELPREKRIVHIAGNSPLKSTHAVVQAMRSLPNIPCDVYWRRSLSDCPPNVTHHKKFVPDISEVMNSALIHLIPSQAEGFGHIINEALACGATVITTNAPPMNELGAQYQVETTGFHTQNLSEVFHLDPTDLRRKIVEAWESEKGFDMEARSAYLHRDKEFRERFAQVFHYLTAKQAA